MSVLRSIEHRIESIVEGVFGRAFRTHVQPVELARKLAKEMDDAKSVSVSRVYVPNEYTVYLCPSDRDQFATYEDSLRTELSDYLSEHARREGYALLSTPRVLIEEDDDLNVGEFGIATRMVQPERPQAPPPPPDVKPQALPSETKTADGARGRYHRRRSERLPAPRRGPARGRRLLDRRPRLDERGHGQREARGARQARARRRDPSRHDRRALRARFLGAQGPRCPSSPSSSRSRPPS